jgi:hypothetical protein
MSNQVRGRVPERRAPISLPMTELGVLFIFLLLAAAGSL